MIQIDFESMCIKNLLRSPKTHNGKVVNIFWSGGVDSTYLMLWLLCHGYYVNAYWVEITGNHAKNDKEKEARKKIVDVIKKEYPELYRNLSYFSKPAVSIDNQGSSKTIIQQAPIWLLATQLINNSHNDFVMGYVSGDDALTWIDAIKGVVKSYNKMTHSSNRVNIHFPMSQLKKKWFFEYIPWEIRKNLFWCEYGRDDPKKCRCGACVTHRHMLDSLGIDELRVD